MAAAAAVTVVATQTVAASATWATAAAAVAWPSSASQSTATSPLGRRTALARREARPMPRRQRWRQLAAACFRVRRYVHRSRCGSSSHLASASSAITRLSCHCFCRRPPHLAPPLPRPPPPPPLSRQRMCSRRRAHARRSRCGTTQRQPSNCCASNTSAVGCSARSAPSRRTSRQRRARAATSTQCSPRWLAGQRSRLAHGMLWLSSLTT
mmetsp:Transcript_72813/g.199782  ORF Transcript_72813/g.199782 Transcript_72813/m.199782 type:complete len:210 (-) Transcript_72813:373-1002(-)